MVGVRTCYRTSMADDISLIKENQMTTLNYFFVRNSEEVGEWLDRNMPNPPLPDTQRWSIINYNSIQFNDPDDATMFKLAWGDGNPPQRRIQ